MNDPERRGSNDRPHSELVEQIAQLDADNERLRLRALDVAFWMEEAVDKLVAEERRVHDLEQQNAALDAELDAMRNTITWRAIQPLRRGYTRLRSLGSGRG